jgi:hypothetical protein
MILVQVNFKIRKPVGNDSHEREHTQMQCLAVAPNPELAIAEFRRQHADMMKSPGLAFEMGQVAMSRLGAVIMMVHP